MDIFSRIATKIIKEQELIIGPLAWIEAKKVAGLKIAEVTKEIVLEGDKKQVIDILVTRYDRLFGRASHEVSREAAAGLLADLVSVDIPASLRD